jgi:hypothetical protein
MADIFYDRKFTHEDWIENVDVVQASGENGFNRRFHGIEDEFDTISGVVNTIANEINQSRRLKFINSQTVNLPGNTASQEFSVETYDRTQLPANVEKVYFAVISPTSGPTNIHHTFLYRPQSGNSNNTAVTVQFFNPGTSAATFTFRILTLADQA